LTVSKVGLDSLEILDSLNKDISTSLAITNALKFNPDSFKKGISTLEKFWTVSKSRSRRLKNSRPFK
jgi:hypothetical protein